jgi:hypothetical protein
VADTETIAYSIMHLTGEQARSVLMLLAGDREEDIRAAIERTLAAR